jgi:hypothetical protein
MSSSDLSPHSRLPVRFVATRYGVCLKTISRWSEDVDMQFPRPLYLRGRRYFRGADLLAWEERTPGFDKASKDAA